MVDKALEALKGVPWTAIITVIGWIVFGATFYTTTMGALNEHTQSIDKILSSRERLLDTYREEQRTNGLKLQSNDNRMSNIEANAVRMEQRIDKIVQVLDRLYDQQTEILRKLNGGR